MLAEQVSIGMDFASSSNMFGRILSGLGLGLVLLVARSQTAGASPPPEVRILYHADVDGRLAAPACSPDGAPGASYASTVGAIARERASDQAAGRPGSIVLLGGNFAAPDPFVRSFLERGDAGIDALSDLLARARYDAIGLGHHDLGLAPHDLDTLVGALRGRGVAVVATNLRCEGSRRALCAAVRAEALVRRDGGAIGVLAVIAPAVLAGIPAAYRHGLALDDPVTTVARAAARLRAQGATRIVLLTQGARGPRSLEEADAFASGLAGKAQIDVVLAGGVSEGEGGAQPLALLLRRGTPPIVGPPSGTPDLVDVSVAGELRPQVALVTPAVQDADPETERQLRSQSIDYCRRYGQTLAVILAASSITRAQFLSYVLEVMRRRAGAEIAVVNRSFVKRVGFPLTGTVTRADLHRALPYASTIGTGRLTGPVVEKLLGQLLDDPRVATVGLAREGGKLEVNGRPLDKARSYRVATIGFVAAGGDDLLTRGSLRWRPLTGDPDLRAAVEQRLRSAMGGEGGDATADLAADFRPPPAAGLLVVGLTDIGLDLFDTSISNAPAYADAQLVRTRQTSLKGELTGLLSLRMPRHEADGRLSMKYGWLRSRPPDGPATSGETADLASFAATYNYKGLRAEHSSAYIPDPYARVRIESELTRPEVTPTQPRTYHHLELTQTAGALVTIATKLKLRAGAGLRKELVASGTAGRWRPLAEAGGTLDPLAIATLGEVAARLEGSADYVLIDPAQSQEHQLRATVRLSVPVLPLVSLTAGLDFFAVQREALGWGSSFDTSVGLRLHLDAARQSL